MAAEMENDQQECQETCSGPWHVNQNGSRRSQDNLKLSKKSAKAGDQTVFLWDDGGIQDVQDGLSDGGRSSLTVLDNIHTLWEAARGKEQAGRPHSHSGGLLEMLRWGTRNSMATNFTEALRQ